MDNTLPTFSPAGALTMILGYTETAANIGTASDSSTVAGSLIVTATGLPTGFAVGKIVNSVGTISADIITDTSAAPGVNLIEFTVTDEAGNTSTASLQVDLTANTAPSIVGPADQMIQINSSTTTLSITVDDSDEGASALTLDVSSDNNILINITSGINIAGSGSSRTIDITPETNNVGTATLTLTVTDTGGATATVSFILTVEDLANAPTITQLADVTMLKNTTSGAISFTIDDPQGAATLAGPTAVSSNATLFDSVGLVLTGTSPDYTLTLTPEADETGMAVVTVSVSDGTVTVSRSFQVSVTEPVSVTNTDDDDEESGCASTGAEAPLWLILLGVMSLVLISSRRKQSKV